jgi:hypothetical protein
MSHLTASEFVDSLEGALPPARRAHLQTCEACRAQADTLRDGVAHVSAIDVPEPSPLFWDHFTNRVREAIASERPARSRWYGFALRPLPLALAAAVLSIGVGLYRAASDNIRSSSAASSHRNEAPVVAARQSASKLDSHDDEVWDLLTAAASGIELEDAHAAGLTVRPGEIERAVMDMTPAERAALGRLLQKELKRAGA